MTGETVEQLKDRLRKEDEGKEEAFQKRLEQLRSDTAKYRAEKEAEERTKQQERERLFAGVRESREREMKDSARLAWLDAGGTGEEFEREWPGMRTEMLKRRIVDAEGRARQEMYQSGVSRI
jgi:hypothetical protein